jgi:hypothetical protein
MPRRRTFALGALAIGVCLVAGCEPKAPRVPRNIGSSALGELTAQALRETYETPAFVVRDVQNGLHVAIRDTELPRDAVVDDSNLLIYVEGSGDRVELSRWTMGLLAESPHGFPAQPHRLVVALLKWGTSHDAVAEHLNRKAQLAGAALLNHMLEVHRQRHGERGHASVIGFSAGTRVTQLAFAGTVPEGENTHPQGLAHADNVVFLGSSVSCTDPTPFEGIRGRFLCFVNPRDTHYGDRAPFIAPAGQEPRLGKFLTLEPMLRHPMFGASVAGFRALPTLTRPEQFEAIQRAGDPATRKALEQAFRMVNVPTPIDLVPFNLFGDPVPNDDLDDYLNLAPNHYVLVGRGPAGQIDDPAFAQYRASAEEFVKEHVAAAALQGRLYRFDLKARPRSAKLLDVPLLLPWAVFYQPSEEKPAKPEEETPAVPGEKTK